MDQMQRKGEGKITKVTPALMKREIKENYTEIERFLKWHGVLIRNGKIPVSQRDKALTLIQKKIIGDSLDIHELAALIS